MEENFKTMSEVDIAYQILKRNGKANPLHYKDLIREVIAKKNKVVQNEAAAISEIYTMINMDSRFQYSDGKWGLSDWYPPEVKRQRGGKSAEIKATSRSKTGSDKEVGEDDSDKIEK